uniref:Reticulon n=1 Tax=Eptatretus burgeri TaxID=7764 RepID=A0A8C4WUY4_EPTBU
MAHVSEKPVDDLGDSQLPDSTAAPCPCPGWKANSAVVDLLHWRDVKPSGAIFGTTLILLLSLSVFSVISVVAYLTLAIISVTISFRVYKSVLQAIQKTNDGHPFKEYLDMDLTVSQECARKYTDLVLSHTNCVAKELRRLFLIQDLVDSLKFALLLWLLTYVGAIFNGLTLLIIGLIAAFTLPIVYDKYQDKIDHYIDLARTHIKDVVDKVQAKMPGAKRKEE